MGVLDLFRLDGKVAVVTGAARGLGQAMAVGLAEAGANLVLIDREDLNQSQELVLQNRVKCFPIYEDLSHVTQSSAQNLIKVISEKAGGLDIWINNAGFIRRQAALEYSESDWMEVLHIHLNAAFYLSQAAGNYFISQKKKGKIIQIASMLSFQGGFMVPSYTAAKSGLAGLTRSLAVEWASLGIQVNAIAPGYFETALTQGIRTDPDRNQKILNRIPLGRYGHPDELKGLVVFLASSASEYLHGAVIPVDGGWLAG